MKNFLQNLPLNHESETFETVFQSSHTHVERIISYGQTTPQDQPYIQANDEWVMVIAGKAILKIEHIGSITLEPNDSVLIPKNHRHWVTYTASPTVWLAVHCDP